MSPLRRLARLFARWVAPVGGCARCRWPWPYVEPHETPVGSGSIAPLCEACWAALDPAARLPHYEDAVARLDAYHRLHGRGPVGPEIIEIVRSAVAAGR